MPKIEYIDQNIKNVIYLFHRVGELEITYTFHLNIFFNQ